MPMKRKRDEEVDTSKPSAVFKPRGPRLHKLSVAIPGSIISNAQSHELKTSLAGQIARALAVFCVDEVIVFDDGQTAAPRWHQHDRNGNSAHDHYGDSQHAEYAEHAEQSYTGYSDPSHFLMHVLSYLEAPPHLRKHLFPLHPNLRTAGTLPSLDMPHHLRADEWCQYREGVTVEDPSPGFHQVSCPGAPKPGQKSRRDSKTTPTTAFLVDTGLRQKVKIDASIPPYTRVTVKFPSAHRPTGPTLADPLYGEAVAPDVPREEAGYYWGYTVRRASSISAIFTECGYDGGYDLSFGTSERGRPLREVLGSSGPDLTPDSGFQHMLLVFGGVQGLEVAVKADRELAERGVRGPEALFDYWVNLHPGQGSRTIRTEEAVWMGLMGLRDVFAE